MASESLGSARSGDRPRGHDGMSDAERHVFAATERLLADLSLRDLSVTRIVEEAGISRATFYFYFSSKFAVVTGLLARVMDEIFQTVQPFIGRGRDDPPEDALRASLTAATAVWASHRYVLRAVHEHWHAVPELRSLWLDVFDGFTASLGERLDRERAAGLLADIPDARRMAASLLWATEGCLYVAGFGVDDDLPSEDRIVEPLVALWVGSLYGVRPSARAA